MAHISKKKLSENTERAIRNKLVEMLRIIGRDKKVSYALKELLTYTESIMLAKRLAIIYLIHEDKSIIDICETLNVSSSTVLRIWKRYDRGGYKNIELIFHKLEPTLVEMIGELLTAGMPQNIIKARNRIFQDD